MNKPLTEIYPPRFFARRFKLNWRIPFVCDAVIKILQPKNLIDIGCATGDLIKGFVERGVDAYGLEGSRNVRQYLEVDEERVRFFDLRDLVCWERRFDLAICLEVAEHIEPEYADSFVFNLNNASDRLLISVAPPGQGGHHHVNCQPLNYWMDKFNDYGYILKPYIMEAFKKEWLPHRNKPGIKAYFQNIAYFERIR